MAVKRGKKKTMPKAASKAYEQAMLAEGAPVALDLLGFGSTIGDVIRGRRRKAAPKRRAKKAKKNVRARVKMSRTKRTKKAKKKSARRTARRRK